MRYELVSISQYGEPINLDIYDFWFITKDAAYAYLKGTRFMACFSKADCYEVVTKKVEG